MIDAGHSFGSSVVGNVFGDRNATDATRVDLHILKSSVVNHVFGQL